MFRRIQLPHRRPFRLAGWNDHIERHDVGQVLRTVASDAASAQFHDGGHSRADLRIGQRRERVIISRGRSICRIAFGFGDQSSRIRRVHQLSCSDRETIALPPIRYSYRTNWSESFSPVRPQSCLVLACPVIREANSASIFPSNVGARSHSLRDSSLRTQRSHVTICK